MDVYPWSSHSSQWTVKGGCWHLPWCLTETLTAKLDGLQIAKASLTPMQFLRTKLVPATRLTGNHKLLCHNTWKPASRRCVVACIWHADRMTSASFAAEIRFKIKFLFVVAWVSRSCGNPWQLLRVYRKHEDTNVTRSVRHASVKQSKPFILFPHCVEGVRWVDRQESFIFLI